MEEGLSAPEEGEEMERQLSIVPLNENLLHKARYPGAVGKKAYTFDGRGNFKHKEWKYVEGSGEEFCWYHVELPKWNQTLSQSAQCLIDLLCPPLKLPEILSLVSNGPYCGHLDGALVFRANSPGPASSKFTFRIAARVTEHSVISVSLGAMPKLGLWSVGQSLMRQATNLETPKQGEQNERGNVVIREHVLEYLLMINHSEEAGNPVPKSVSNLLVHIISTHVDHLQDVVTKLEIELDSAELELDKGGVAVKRKVLDDRRFPKMHLDLQRLLQVIAHGEQVFPRVKEKLSSKGWSGTQDLDSLEELIGQLNRLKESVGFIANRVTAIQTGLDSWQSEQINRKLYYLSIISIIFLPLSIITGVFGMNVGGIPWIVQNNREPKDGFRNVIFLCLAVPVFLLLCCVFPALCARIIAWHRKGAVKRS
ncbi:hypothetical protein RJ639_035363 [Escallonia herrerae]|uniref:Mg2+ transporter protein n=1 Tax=Escallonia herrerae TaxID=1293975 RepID=A0AA88WNJ4_9ASTE|nr:hypothetical protein RJ639_035363 [Escallonia herrerae]